MAAQAGFNAPALTWQQILAAMQTQPIPPSGPSATAAAAPTATPQTRATHYSRDNRSCHRRPCGCRSQAPVDRPCHHGPGNSNPGRTRRSPDRAGPDASADLDPHPAAHADAEAAGDRPGADADAAAVLAVAAPWTSPAPASPSYRSCRASTRRSSGAGSAC